MLVCVWYVVALMLVFPLCCLLLVNCYLLFLEFFFMQAEDGIRDRDVTGVHTCALPILYGGRRRAGAARRTWAGWAASGRARCAAPGRASRPASAPRRPARRAAARPRRRTAPGRRSRAASPRRWRRAPARRASGP